MLSFKTIFFILLGLFLSLGSNAENTAPLSSTFNEYTVHHSTFNSTFIKPDIAAAYKITRAKNKTLINISVTRTINNKTSLGLPAITTGTATNLIQQQYALEFIEIREKNTIYYIAQLPHGNEEIFHFNFLVTPKDTKKTHEISFTKKLYFGE